MSDEAEKLKLSHSFLNYRTVVLTGDVTRRQCDVIVDQLTELQFRSGSEPAKLLIKSTGGDVGSAYHLCDFIDHVLEIPVHGIVLSQCYSAATFIYLSCIKRFCTPHSAFLFHSLSKRDVSIRMDDSALDNLEDLSVEIEDNRRRCHAFYQKKLGLPKQAVTKLLKRGDQNYNDFMRPEEAKQIGLVHKILTGKAGIFPSFKT